MKYFYATLIGIALVIGGMFLPSLASAQVPVPSVCAQDSSKAVLKSEFPVAIDMDKYLALTFIKVVASQGQTPPPGLVDKVDSGVYIEKGPMAGVFFFDADGCYMTAVTGTVENIKRIIAQTVGWPA